ncbi:hypothetical protein LTS15_008217 [Exophiala xenobiotica]|nr:hypothetical protein LTS15_008217 [Exophiala xenobiotica]
MSLVTYSDSEGSDDEKPQIKAAPPKPSNAPINSNFTVNRANPRKIQVKLHDTPSNGDGDGEPTAKRPRVGAGAFSGFNALLPAPKRDADVKTTPKPAARKVFSLKTGAEPGFSREADAEMRQFFAEQETVTDQQAVNKSLDQDDTMPSVPKKSEGVEGNGSIAQPPKGNAFMFKPLSVARNNKKTKRKADTARPVILKSADGLTTSSSRAVQPPAADGTVSAPAPAPAPKKISLFGMGSDAIPELDSQLPDEEDEIVEVLDEPEPALDSFSSTSAAVPSATSAANQGQSLDSIASDLGLSKADRRQLFGRRGDSGGTAINVFNFNTDQEYAANEALRASGEQVQHNPVRGIAPGKHSLKQLLSAATNQADALEESFATGRKNKKEAGSKYGW